MSQYTWITINGLFLLFTCVINIELLSIVVAQTAFNNTKDGLGNQFALIKRFNQCEGMEDLPFTLSINTKQQSKNEYIMNGYFQVNENFPFNDTKNVRGKIIKIYLFYIENKF